MLISNYTDLGLHRGMGGGIKIKFSFLMSFWLYQSLAELPKMGALRHNLKILHVTHRRDLFFFLNIFTMEAQQIPEVLLSQPSTEW